MIETIFENGLIVRITDDTLSLSKEVGQRINQERLAILQELLDYFVYSEHQVPTQFKLGPSGECFLNALFNVCAKKRINSLTLSSDKSFGRADIVDKAQILLPTIFSNFQVNGATIPEKLNLVKSYIDSINKRPNLQGEYLVAKNEIDDLKRKAVELKKEYNKTLVDLDNVPDNDADGGCRLRELRQISDITEKRYQAVLARIPKNDKDAFELTKYFEPHYHIYNDYIFTPSLFNDAGVKINSKALVFDEDFLIQFIGELITSNVQCENVETEAKKILMQFLQAEEPPTTHIQSPDSDSALNQ